MITWFSLSKVLRGVPSEEWENYNQIWDENEMRTIRTTYLEHRISMFLHYVRSNQDIFNGRGATGST